MTTIQTRTVLAGPRGLWNTRLALYIAGLLGTLVAGSLAACSGTIETQETKPISSAGSSGRGAAPTTASGSAAVDENAPNISGRASGSGSDGQQTTDDLATSGSRASAGGGRARRVPTVRRDAGNDDDAGVEQDAGIELDGGVEDAGALVDAGANAAQ